MIESPITTDVISGLIVGSTLMIVGGAIAAYRRQMKCQEAMKDQIVQGFASVEKGLLVNASKIDQSLQWQVMHAEEDERRLSALERRRD